VKLRVIPVILVKGETQYKGERFNNWRVVGNPVASARLHSARDVDEVLVIDINATAENRTLSPALIGAISDFLRVPLCVGGGIRNEKDIETCLMSGADKVLLGTTPALNLEGLQRFSEVFGSQALVCSVDGFGKFGEKTAVMSGQRSLEISPTSLAVALEEFGAGELLVQHIEKDGLQSGMPVNLVRDISSMVKIPVIASTGMGTPDHAVEAASAGAAAVASGAMLQFTHYTPTDVKNSLESAGFPVRR